MKKGLAIGIVAVVLIGAALGGVLYFLNTDPLYEAVDLTSHTEAPQAETFAREEKEVKAPETKAPETQEDGTIKVTATIDTYKEGDIRIAYPTISGLTDEVKQNQLNDKLKANALSILDYYVEEPEEATVSIGCKIITVNINEVCAVYEGSIYNKGSAYPSNVYYTNTVRIKDMTDMGFWDYEDPYTMAGYTLSSDVKLRDGSLVSVSEFRNYIADMDIKLLQEMLEWADFPIKGDEFPECFSYAKNGSLFFSIPVTHAMGDYVVVEYSPNTK